MNAQGLQGQRTAVAQQYLGAYMPAAKRDEQEFIIDSNPENYFGYYWCEFEICSARFFTVKLVQRLQGGGSQTVTGPEALKLTKLIKTCDKKELIEKSMRTQWVSFIFIFLRKPVLFLHPPHLHFCSHTF